MTTTPALPDSQELEYDIHSVSSFSAAYAPDNIKYDLPTDQGSRWSGATNLAAAAASKDANPTVVAGVKDRQWLCLKLEKKAIVRAHSLLGLFRAKRLSSGQARSPLASSASPILVRRLS